MKILTSLYKNVKSCVKFKGELSNHFSTNFGLLQGEVLSPVMFSFYVNDFEINFIKDECESIELQMINLFLLMYADDRIFMSESQEGLQKMLSSLGKYTKE